MCSGLWNLCPNPPPVPTTHPPTTHHCLLRAVPMRHRSEMVASEDLAILYPHWNGPLVSRNHRIMHVFNIQAEWIFDYLKESVLDKAGSGPPRIALVSLDTTFSDMTIKKVYNRSERISKLIAMSWL